MCKKKLRKSYEKLSEAGISCEVIGNALLVNDDCMRVLRRLPSNSIHSCVTDGPYGIGFMGKKWDNFKLKTIKKGTKRKGGAGISPSMFSGKYDLSRQGLVRFQQFSYEWAVELFRVLKPGAFMVSFCAPRTYHRMATGIEDAGFEVKDQLQWLFGVSLSKSLDIGKSIDKLLGAEREIVGPNPNRKGRINWDTKPKNITLPATRQSEYWNGWGTALRSLNEPILLARKPLSEKSVARNVLRHGTGGINIEACRIGDEGADKAVKIINENDEKKAKVISLDKGRYPANTIIDEDVAKMLRDKAKFFYCPKISKKERNAGCEHLEAKQQNSKGKGRTYNDRCAVCKKKFIGSEKTRCQCPPGVKKTDKSVYKNKNHHPTVKPIALMEYLVKLVTPANGICLDIFMGSGTTGIACSNLGFSFIGIEKEPEYFEIAKARIQHWQNVKKVA